MCPPFEMFKMLPFTPFDLSLVIVTLRMAEPAIYLALGERKQDGVRDGQRLCPLRG